LTPVKVATRGIVDNRRETPRQWAAARRCKGWMMNAAGIGRFFVRVVATVSRNATVADAAMLMRERHIGSVVVVDADDKPIGMLTDRDIVVEVVAAGLRAETVKVAEIIQRPLVTVRDDATYAETVRLMSQHGVRRMPVVSKDGKLAGIVAADDLLRQLAGPLVALSDLGARERHFETETRP
jgi:CBS domain-containing protein